MGSGSDLRVCNTFAMVSLGGHAPSTGHILSAIGGLCGEIAGTSLVTDSYSVGAVSNTGSTVCTSALALGGAGGVNHPQYVTHRP